MFTLLTLMIWAIFTLLLSSKKSCFSSLSVLLVMWLFVTPTSLMDGPEILSSLFQIDTAAFLLIALSLLTQAVVLLIASNYSKLKYSSMAMILWILLGFLVMTFSASALFEFYIYFEASLFPIFGLIVLWGYQPERFKASLMLLFYTSIASLPLLLLALSVSFSSFYISSMLISVQPSSILHEIYQLLFLLAVLIKIPIFGPHQWLPKAHVEAPVEGSMVLAAVLLKLGGYGLLRLLPISGSNSNLTLGIISLSLIGSSLISLICLYQFDLKILIAYSSVAHMSLVIAPLLISSNWGAGAGLVVMIAHGSSSSLLFALAHLMYKLSSSRSILFNKGILLALPLLSLSLFLACCTNMAAPLSFNLMGELLAVISLVKSSALCLLPFSFMMFMAAAYSLALYSLTQHGKVQWGIANTLTLSKVDSLMIILHIFFSSSVCLALTLFT